jgi:ABC-type transporter Mla MlaB component
MVVPIHPRGTGTGQALGDGAMPLAGYVDRKYVRRAIRRMRRQARSAARGGTFVLDCRGVEDFCGYALADLVDFRRQLQWRGLDLELTGCSDSVRARMAVPLFESLLAREPICHAPGAAD